jgi:glycosyltransferase involved in cell wall biosynthesis
MIRVAHVLHTMEVGGSEQMVLELCRHRDRTAFDCVVAAPEEGVIVDEIRQTGASVHTGPGAFQAAVCDADLINQHWFGYDPAGLALLHAAARPFVITLHCAVALPPLPARTICTSEHAYDLQQDRSRCVLIPNGVDVARFDLPRKPPGEEVILTRVCRPAKCATYFWDAMQRVLDCYPQTRLWIVGNPEGCDSRSERIRFLGVRRDVPRVLAESDLFVYTPYPEAGSLDLVALEAGAAGVPCIVSDVSAVRPAVLDGVNGFRTPFGDIDAFVEKVGKLVEDPALRARMGRAAVQLVRQRFDIRTVARRYEQVYRSVLEANRNGAVQP